MGRWVTVAAQVMKATELKSGTKWAIKVINKAQSGTSRIKLFQREISILRAVHHPHIIHLERVFESPKTLFLVFELCLGELREVFLKKKVFTEDETRKVVASLASAVSYLHRNDIVHRDLKLENILVSTNPSDPEDNLFIKVTDFGLSGRIFPPVEVLPANLASPYLQRTRLNRTCRPVHLPNTCFHTRVRVRATPRLLDALDVAHVED